MEFHYHDISPPAQAVWMTLNTLGIKYDAQFVDLLKGDQRKESYLAINPSGKVPAIKDGTFALAESRPIAVYLCLKTEPKEKREKLYPTDLQQMAKVNMLLSIDNTNYQKIYDYASIGRMLQGLPLEDDKLPGVHEALTLMEDFLSKSKYVAADHVTIADYFALTTVKLLDLTPFNDYVKYPSFVKWKDAMQKLPHYEESIGKHVGKYATQFLATK